MALTIDKRELLNILRNAGHIDTEVARRRAALDVIGHWELAERLRVIAQALKGWRARHNALDEAEGGSASWLAGETRTISPDLERAITSLRHYQIEYEVIVNEILALADAIENDHA